MKCNNDVCNRKEKTINLAYVFMALMLKWLILYGMTLEKGGQVCKFFNLQSQNLFGGLNP